MKLDVVSLHFRLAFFSATGSRVEFFPPMATGSRIAGNTCPRPWINWTRGFGAFLPAISHFRSRCTSEWKNCFLALAEKLQDKLSVFFNPLYIAGQMFEAATSGGAAWAYSLAMYINPNNQRAAWMGGRRGRRRWKKEAVAEIAGMFGWKEFLGHLCGGGNDGQSGGRCGWRGRFIPGKKNFGEASRRTTTHWKDLRCAAIAI